MKQKQYIEIRHAIRGIIKGTEWEGHVFVVGGCVRDEIMGLDIKDIDMVIDMPNGGIQFAKWMYLNGYTMNEPVVFQGFGTAMFCLKSFPEFEIECVQTRKEKYPDRRSRNPEVSRGTIEEDSFRRDLTINTLGINISTEELIDITGHGVDDIRNKVIRTPLDPDITYDDDPLRILRCIRFASRYGWQIEDRTYEGMKSNVHRLDIITMERVRDELDKMLTCKNPVMAMELLRKTGAMSHIIPEFEETYDMTQNHYHFGTVWEHTMKALELIDSSDLVLRMAVLLHDIGKVRSREVSDDGRVHFIGHNIISADMAEEILKRLKYPNHFINEVKFLVFHHMDTKEWKDDLSRMKPKHLRRLQHECKTEHRFRQLMLLIDADNKAHAEGYCLMNQVQRLMERTEAMKKEGSALFDYKLPFTGADVMRLKGIKPCPAVKDCMKYLMKLAYVDPLRPMDQWTKHLIGYKIR